MKRYWISLNLLNGLYLNSQFFALLPFQFFPTSHWREVTEWLCGAELPTRINPHKQGRAELCHTYPALTKSSHWCIQELAKPVRLFMQLANTLISVFHGTWMREINLPTNSWANTLAAKQQTFTVTLNSRFVTLTSKRWNMPEIQLVSMQLC